MAGLFQVLWGVEEGVFKSAEVLADADGEPLSIPEGDDVAGNGGVSLESICTRPTAVDWDADGDLDLVVGNFSGSFYLFLGEGDGVFQTAPQAIRSGGDPLMISGHHSDPFVVDWDGDGDLDLLSGSSEGGVQWAENRAGAGQPPELMAFEVLIRVGTQINRGQLLRDGDLVGAATSTRIWVDDVNEDGKLDMLVGDSVTLTSPAVGLSIEDYEQRLADWQELFDAASDRLTQVMEQSDTSEDQQVESSGFGNWLKSLVGLGAPPSDLDKARDELSTLYQQRSEFMTSEATGFVWLYLQK